MSEGYTLPYTAPTAELPDSSPSSDAADDSPLPDRLRAALGSGYELGPKIGQGGMGVVFRATDLRLKRDVAVKVLPPEVTYRSDLRKRFVREAQMAASLTHPHIVPVYDVGQGHGLAWIVMAFIQGESVRDLVRRAGPQPAHFAARVMREVAWALSYAHARGIVHRDIKPDNIMIDRASGRAIVMDFGLAKIDSEEESLTLPGKILGTPAYMSPEQARGRDEIDHRSDIYSLGLVGYFMLAARNPFDANNAATILARVISETPPDPLTARPDTPVWLADAIKKCVERSPAKRHPKAEDLADALDRGQTPKEPATSVQYVMFWCEAYIELSTLAAIFIWVVGIPPLKPGSAPIIACLLALPLLISFQLFNAEGLAWSDIREGIVAWRINSLRRLSLKHASGTNRAYFAVIAVTVIGVFLIRWIGPLVNRYYDFFSPEWTAWMPLDDTGPSPEEQLFRGPKWALAYAAVGWIVWNKLFGLPSGKRLSPVQLDRVASWRLPAWFDYLGSLMFMRIGASEKAIEATAELRQLFEPAVREALAFKRASRAISFRSRRRLCAAIHLGNLVVRRVWGIHERLGRWRDYLASREPGTPRHEALAAKIAEREGILAECAAALESLRLALEEAATPGGEQDCVDPHLVAELRRLTRRLRVARAISTSFAAAWVASLAVGTVLSAYAPGSEPVVRVIALALFYSLPVFIAFMLLKRKLYT